LIEEGKEGAAHAIDAIPAVGAFLSLGEQVFFSLDERTGIVCDNCKHVREYFVCSMAEGVHAYRYQRL
jgi:hypothetical protein